MKRVVWWGLVVPAVIRRLLPAWFFESPLVIAARHPWLALGGAGAAALLLGLGVAASGVIPMRASTGHWPITERFLHFAMRQSVITHARPIDVPPLDDPALAIRGAAHYELGCRACHGGPAGDAPHIPRRMVPPPRELRTHAADWRPRELFYIVKHGMKFTGMPAWPAQQRDDEVWAMVAFLRRLPSVDVAEYSRLVRGESSHPFDLGTEGSESPRLIRDNCARCHGVDGIGRGTGAFPAIAGQRAEYLDRALRAYADGRRFSGIMGPIAASLSAADRAQAVGYYAALPPRTPAQPRDDARVARGMRLAAHGVPERLIPPCAECHGPGTAPKNPAYPRLAGQYEEYLNQQLRLLRARQRGGSDYVHLMHSFVDRLTDEQVQDAAAYFASTP